MGCSLLTSGLKQLWGSLKCAAQISFKEICHVKHSWSTAPAAAPMNCVCVEAMFPLGYSQPVAEHGRGTVLAHSCGTLDSSNGNFGFETIFSLSERFLELLCSLWRFLPNPPSFFLSSQSVRLALWFEGTPCLLWLLLLYLSQPFPPINLLHILPYVELWFKEELYISWHFLRCLIILTKRKKKHRFGFIYIFLRQY